MIKLIDSKLVAKLMNEAAKECGMTRLYSSTDDIWWGKINEIAGIDRNDNDYSSKRWELRDEIRNKYRRIVKAYDFIANNFIELLEAKVKAEGFDLSDNKITFSKCPETEKDYAAMKEKYGDNWWRHDTNIYKDHKMKGGTYVRMTVAFIGPRQYKKFVPYYDEPQNKESSQGETFGVTESAIYYDENGM
jgi:hypothetical protein